MRRIDMLLSLYQFALIFLSIQFGLLRTLNLEFKTFRYSKNERSVRNLKIVNSNQFFFINEKGLYLLLNKKMGKRKSSCIDYNNPYKNNTRLQHSKLISKISYSPTMYLINLQ